MISPRTDQGRAAFSFVEVICILLIVGIGLTGVVGVVAYGLIIAAKSQGRSTGMITAMSIANDPYPLLDPAMSADWKCVDYCASNMDGAGTLTGKTSGFINGYYVERTETSTDADIVARDLSNHVHVRSALVVVDVYDTVKGSLIASYNTRLLRQRGVAP